jgi:GNAT superfamily N-acetyltransferase
LAALVDLLEAYMRETYRDTWHGSMNSLQRDAFGKECTIHVAEVGGHVVGFVAWTNSYDLHHCLTGGDILDLYVRPSWRGLGFAPALLCSAAAELLRRGATHLKGGAVDRGTGEHLYARCAASSGAGGFIVSGRAFRKLAELGGVSPRQLARSLPPKTWNYEA